MQVRAFCALLTLALGCEAAPAPEPLLETLERGGTGGPTVVLLHGYGSRPEHLLPMTERTDWPAGTRIVLPRAPLDAGVPDGRMWWALAPPFTELPRRSASVIAPASRRVGSLVEALAARRPGPIVLGGFSQGAMLALDVALRDRRHLAGLVLLSGTLVDEASLPGRLSGCRGLPVFMAHGRQDEVLPFADDERLAAILRAGGLDVRSYPFDGRHVPDPGATSAAVAFVRELSAR